MEMSGTRDGIVVESVGEDQECPMKTIEFEADLTVRGVLEIPPEVAAGLPVPGHARVILIVGEGEADEDWQRLSYQQFLRSYSVEDAIYDEYDKHRGR
jgi:hypothetical protein